MSKNIKNSLPDLKTVQYVNMYRNRVLSVLSKEIKSGISVVINILYSFRTKPGNKINIYKAFYHVFTGPNASSKIF